MPRFILMDQSLVGAGGHHFDFARHVLGAAHGAGYQTVLAAHRECELANCGESPTRPVFRDGMWTHEFASPALRNLGRIVSVLRRLGRQADRWQHLAACWRDKVRGMRFAHDAGLLTTDLRIEKGDLVFVPNMTCAEVIGLAQLFREQPEVLSASWHLEFHLPVYPPGARHRAEILGAVRHVQNSLRRLHAAARSGAVFLYTDTDELTAQYESLSAGHFATLPIPIGPEFCATKDREQSRCASGAAAKPTNQSPAGARRPLCVAYAGGARDEKGYPQLPGLIGHVWPDLVETRRIQFVIQSNCRRGRRERCSARARDDLLQFPQTHVRVLTDPLESADYRSLIVDSDVLLFPYQPHTYAARSSGILAEALAAGIPTIVPANTWLSRQLENAWPRYMGVSTQSQHSTAHAGNRPPVPGLVYRGGADQFANALRRLVANYDHYRDTARSLATNWSAHHNGRRLLEILLEREAAGAFDALPAASGPRSASSAAA